MPELGIEDKIERHGRGLTQNVHLMQNSISFKMNVNFITLGKNAYNIVDIVVRDPDC